MTKATYLIDGKEVSQKGVSTIKWIDDKYFTIYFLGKKFNGEVVSSNLEDHILTVKVNQRTFDIKRNQPLDELISALGLDKKKVKKLHELKSPMPGRILNYAVETGAKVEEGTPLLTLEAMKMENVIKAEGEGVVKNIVQPSDAVVEKGQLLIEFE